MKRKLVVTLIGLLLFSVFPTFSWASDTPYVLIRGDLNGDKLINSADYSILKKMALSMEDHGVKTDLQRAADVDCDNFVDSKDLAILKRYLLGIIKSLPAQLQDKTMYNNMYQNVSDVFEIGVNEGGAAGLKYTLLTENNSCVRFIDSTTIYTGDKITRIYKLEALNPGRTTITFVSNNSFSPEISYIITVKPLSPTIYTINANLADPFEIVIPEGGIAGANYQCVIEDEGIVTKTDLITNTRGDMITRIYYFKGLTPGTSKITFVSKSIGPDINYVVNVTN